MAAVGKPIRLTGWALLARDAEMLRAHDDGMTAREIARKFGTTARHVERRLAEARKAQEHRRYEADAEPAWVHWMVPLFPIGSFTPGSKCAHEGPIQRGSYLYCPVCHQAGMDHHPAMRRDPRAEPKPEPKPPAAAPKASAMTRRARRALRRAAP